MQRRPQTDKFNWKSKYNCSTKFQVGSIHEATTERVQPYGAS